jgi:DNA-binding Xre family transcriptional regulator
MLYRIHKISYSTFIFASVIVFNLKHLLEKHGISSYKFERSVEGYAPVTIKKIVSGENNPSLESLDKIITALRNLTGENVTPNDLLEYIPDKPSKAKK